MDELTTREAADELQVSMRWIQKLIDQGRIRATKKGRDYFISRDALDEYRRVQGINSPTPPQK